MRFLVRLLGPKGDSGALLASARSLARQAGVEVRNPKWTSYGALEIDVFSPRRADFDFFLSVLSPLAKVEFVHDLNVAPPHRTDEGILSEARDLFNHERYWECHEVLEGLWRQKQGDEKRLLQGVILVCAALVHHQKSEDMVALGVLRRAAQQLEHSKPAYGGLDVTSLEQSISRILAAKSFTNFQI